MERKSLHFPPVQKFLPKWSSQVVQIPARIFTSSPFSRSPPHNQHFLRFITRMDDFLDCPDKSYDADYDSESEEEDDFLIACLHLNKLNNLMLIARTLWLKRRTEFRNRRFLQRARRTVAMLQSTWHVNQFKNTFRMTEICFRHLVEILHPYLPSVNQRKNRLMALYHPTFVLALR